MPKSLAEIIVTILLARGYLNHAQLHRLLQDLEEVRGDRSFREDVQSLSASVHALGYGGAPSGPERLSGSGRKYQKSGSIPGLKDASGIS